MLASTRTVAAVALALALVLVASREARADGEVQVLRGRRELSSLSSNGNGGSIDRLKITVDLRVQNLAYEKVVGVRSTLDDWQTTVDTRAYWVEDFADGSEHWRVDVDGGTVGTNVSVGGGRGSLGPAWFRYAAYYQVLGRTYWDNAGGHDHAVAVLAPGADPLPEARVHPATTLASGVLYLAGGRSTDGYGLAATDVLALDASGSWRKVADLPALPLSAQPGQPASPELFSRLELVASQGRLFVAAGEQIHVGGWPLGTASLDPTTGRWTSTALLPGPLFDRRAVATATGYELVPTLADRTIPGDPSGDAYAYDAAHDTWSRHPVAGLALLAAPAYATVELGGKLYLLGGDAALAYDPATGTVQRLATSPAPIPPGALAVALGSSQIAVASPDAAGQGTQVLVYDLLAASFSSLPGEPALGAAASLAPVPPAFVGTAAGASRTIAPFLVLTGGSRVDSCEPFAGILARGVARTTVRVRAPAGASSVTLRGSAAPLSWAWGTPMAPTGSPGLWTWDSTEVLDPGFRVKPLAYDARWYPGADLTVAPGATLRVDGGW